MRRTAYFSLGLSTLVACGMSACIDPDSPLIEESSEGCEEFGTASIDDIDVHPEAKAFLVAASDFTKNADAIAEEVRAACARIATDLGAEDTWSAFEDIDDAISNDGGTGACDAAGVKIEEILLEAERVDAHVAILVSEGQCYPDFEAQAACDAECAANAECTPGTVETRCEPGSLSVMCQASCEADASCVGTAEKPANCMGQCESECVGECKGTCYREDGTTTENDPDCVGKCSSSCNGTCRGVCKVEEPAGIACGAEVRCTGGCSGEYTEPKCTSEFTPPECMVNAECHAACSAQVMANCECDPTQVDIIADIQSSPELQVLVDTLEENLPPLLDAANHHGKLLLQAADRLGDSGDTIRDNVDDLDGKSLACLGTASSQLGDSIGALDVSVNASATLDVQTHETLK